MKKDAAYFMRKALAQAVAAEKRGEVPVGAVVVRDSRVIGRGANGMISRRDPTAHAEVTAIRRAARSSGSYRIVGADLYVTLEPCLLCYSAMVQARIRRLFYGAADPKTGIFSTGVFRKAEGVFNHRIEVEPGLLAEQGSALLKEFFRARRGAGAVERDGLENRYTG